jgi:hypothetical protein
MGTGELQVGSLLGLGDYLWRVIGIEGKQVTVLSEYIVDRQPYHDRQVVITWEKCSLRAWLNGEFFGQLPQDARKRMLCKERNNPPNKRYGTPGGLPTSDLVYLLSEDELSQLPDEWRKGKLEDGTSAWWWLRSPGGGPGFYPDGNIHGDYSVSSVGGVRPALLLNLES